MKVKRLFEENKKKIGQIISRKHGLQLIKDGKAESNGTVTGNDGKKYTILTRYDTQTTCHFPVNENVNISESEENQGKDYKEAFQKYVDERKKLKIKIDYEKDEKRKRDLQRQFADLKDEFYKKWH
jgi:hypothetical protein